MSRFHPVDRQTGYLLPPSVDEWLPEDHLARFIVEVIDGLDVSALEKAYAGRGSAAYHPSVLLALLVYGYANGVFSSRKIERATYDSVAFRFIAAGTHPDHDTLASFRRRFLDELAGLFVQVLEMAREMKLLKLGTISLDGTKIKANASRHFEQMQRLAAGSRTRIEHALSALRCEQWRGQLRRGAGSASITPTSRCRPRSPDKGWRWRGWRWCTTRWRVAIWSSPLVPVGGAGRSRVTGWCRWCRRVVAPVQPRSGRKSGRSRTGCWHRH